MDSNTISDAVTMPGGAEGALLANRYRIVRQLGQGGMGSVWLVEDIQLDGKLFAIKMLPSILVSNKRAYRQLKDEALVAMRLVHPNIVQIRAFEENNGNPFLVMDYIDGQTLDDYLAEKGTLSEEEAVKLLKPIAAALDYAHVKGVVHRDVKPGNVMIAKDGHPYILDFGIAREIQETMTRVTGKLSSGTLLYMSPEQLRGQPTKAAQDVYSFAAMAYECLKGEPPFARGQIEYQILNEQPEPLPEGMRLSASVMRGLSKSPADRLDACAKVLLGVSLARQSSSENKPPIRVTDPAVATQSESCDINIVDMIRSIFFVLVVLAFFALVALAMFGGVVRYRNGQRQKVARLRSGTAQQAESALIQSENKTMGDMGTPRRENSPDQTGEADGDKAKDCELVANAQTALQVLYFENNGVWPSAILNATKHGGYCVMDENVAIELYKHGFIDLDCKVVSSKGRTGYKLLGKDRCGIVDSWASDALKNANVNADGKSLLSLNVSSGGTVEDHRIYFAVDKNDDGLVDKSEGAPVEMVRAIVLTWCAGADGVLATEADNVYSWKPAQEVRVAKDTSMVSSTTNVVVSTSPMLVVHPVTELAEVARLREHRLPLPYAFLSPRSSVLQIAKERIAFNQ